MKSTRYLAQWLEKNASKEPYLFLAQDFRALIPGRSKAAFKGMLSRAVNAGHLIRVCRGVYLYERTMLCDGLLLFHAAVLLRSRKFNYISVETALSEAGVISQVPMQWISIMSSGRSAVISCGEFGTIEFIHTERKPVDVMDQLSYDKRCGLWRASVVLAIKDMKMTRRNCDLIDWDEARVLL